MRKIDNICVFSGSSTPAKEIYAEKTIELGKLLAEKHINLVYGGGNRGLMGILASTVRENGGHVIGVLPEIFNVPEVRTKDNESELIVTPDMHSRKKMMYDKADAFIALPGGIGTFDELFESYTWKQIGFHDKPVLLMNIDGFYDELLSFLDKTVELGFLGEEARNSLLVEEDAEKAISALMNDERVLPSKI